MPFTLRRTNDDPPYYRVKYDGVEIGSISKKHHHVEHRDFWSWGIDNMPMMSHGGRPPCGKPLRNGKIDWRQGSLRRT